MPFVNRTDAGRQLALRLSHLRAQDVIVLGLPRGGVPVAFEIAHALSTPLDIIAVRKLGVPFQPELAMGAIGENGVRVLNSSMLQLARVDEMELAEVERKERAELERRAHYFRSNRPRISLVGKTAVIVDDGIATGSTARGACQVAKVDGAAHVILAVPVASREALAELETIADEVICLETPTQFYSVGQWYIEFGQTTDDEVVNLLHRAMQKAPMTAETARNDPPQRDEEVIVSIGNVQLAGHLTVPEHPIGIVLFAHGSGSSRHSPRNRYVATILNQARLATVLFDLLTRDEELDRADVFDVDLLANRLIELTAWWHTQPESAHIPVGYFGASTGAAAALWAAGRPEADVAAVVSRGGRPDLAAARLASVRAPTLLIVGSLDEVVLALNRQAQYQLHCENHLAIVPGATHLFEEPQALTTVASLAQEWFVKHLTLMRQQ